MTDSQRNFGFLQGKTKTKTLLQETHSVICRVPHGTRIVEKSVTLLLYSIPLIY